MRLKRRAYSYGDHQTFFIPIILINILVFLLFGSIHMGFVKLWLVAVTVRNGHVASIGLVTCLALPQEPRFILEVFIFTVFEERNLSARLLFFCSFAFVVTIFSFYCGSWSNRFRGFSKCKRNSTCSIVPL